MLSATRDADALIEYRAIDRRLRPGHGGERKAADHAAEAVRRFSMSAAMLSATLAADVFIVSRARWAYRAVVCTEQFPDHRQVLASSQHLRRRRWHRHHPRSDLAVRQPHLPGREVQVLPPKRENLVPPAPRQHQQPDRCGRLTDR